MTDTSPQTGPARVVKVAKNLILRYVLGLLAALIALLIRWPLWVIVGTTRPYLTFYPAIILSGWYCGFGPGVVTAMFSALFVLYGMDRGQSPAGPDYLTGAMFVVAGSMAAAIAN